MLLLNRFSQWLNERSGMGGKGDMSGGSFKARNRISSSQIENLFRKKSRTAIISSPLSSRR